MREPIHAGARDPCGPHLAPVPAAGDDVLADAPSLAGVATAATRDDRPRSA
jgi:hypothetical protein